MLISLGVLLTALSIILHFQKTMDFKIQELFRSENLWLVSSDQTIYHKIFYAWPKQLAVLFGVLILFTFFYRKFKNKKFDLPSTLALIVVVFLPLLIGGLKSITGQPCPNDFLAFGGSLPDALMYQPGSKCFPGAHASTGLALLAFCFFIQNRSVRIAFATFVFIWSWAIAFYQMARGMHFLSDSLASFGIAFVFYGMAEKKIDLFWKFKTEQQQ